MYILEVMEETLIQQNLSNPADTADFIILYLEF
jgi:hypothetical protein